MKYSDYSFINGALYFFGLAANPADNILETHFRTSDTERLLGDWYSIGNDIRKSYETCKATSN